MGSFDDLIPGEAPASGTFDDLVPKRGPISEIATAAKRGFYEGVKGAGAVLQAPAEMAHEEPGAISRFGAKMEAFGKENAESPELKAQPEAHGGVTNFLSEAAAAPGQALPLLASTIPAASVGAAAGTALAPGAGTVAGAVGGALASGVAGGSTVALQTYHEKYHEALEKGLADDKARDYAAKSAALQGGAMGAVSAVPFAGPAVRTVVGAAGKTAADAAADVAGKRFLPEFGKSAAELAAVNTGLGVAGAAGQSVIDEGTGLPTPGPLEAAKAAFLPSLAGAFGFLPLGAYGAFRTAAESGKVSRALADPATPTADRLRAALAVHAAIDQVDPAAAAEWDRSTAEAIHAGEPVALDGSYQKRESAPSPAPGEIIPKTTPEEPIPPAAEVPPLSTVDPSRGPLSAAAALSEHGTLPAFPFASEEAAHRSVEGREAPEGWKFEVERHPSVVNRWAVTLREMEKEEKDARALEGEAGSDDRAAQGETPAGTDHGEGVAGEAAKKAAMSPEEAADQRRLIEGRLADAETHEQAAAGASGSPEVKEKHGDAAAKLRKEAAALQKDLDEHGPRHVDALAHEAATSPLNPRPEPTPAQVEAGNYKKGHLEVRGMDISVENPAGSIRKGEGWEQVMHDHYGYIRGTIGRDKDHVDVFVGPNPESPHAFVVDQVNPKTGRFDEHKVILGAESLAEARDIYKRNYSADWAGGKTIRPTDIAGLKTWLKTGDMTKPFAEHLAHAKPIEDLKSAADAVRKSTATHEHVVAMDRAQEAAAKAGVPQAEILKAVKAETAGGDARGAEGARAPAQAERAVQDFQSARGEVMTFTRKKEAQAFMDSNKVPRNYSPRSTPDGWVLSRAKIERSDAQKANDRSLAAQRATFNPERDPLATFLGKMGGIKADELLRDGVDAKDLKDLRSGVVGKPAYRMKGGLSLDGMAEMAAQHGFDVLDEAGRPDASKMRDLIQQEVDGTHIYTPEGYERLASLADEDRAREEAATAEKDFSDEELHRAGYDALTDDEKEVVGLAFDDDLDRLIADAALTGDERGLTDDEANALFGRPEEQVREAPEGASAGEPAEGSESREEPSRDQDGESPREVAQESTDTTPSKEGVAVSGAPKLELKGETEAEIKAREALAAKEAAEKKARDNAPAPEGFVLTGSNSPADLARAHGQQELMQHAADLPAEKPEAPIEAMAPLQAAAGNDQPARIADFGEKIGGARKDLAVPLGKRMPKADDERPGWARKYVAMQVQPSNLRFRQEGIGKWELMKETGGLRGSVDRVMRGKFFDTEEAALASIPLAEVSRNHRVYSYKEGDATKYGIYRILGDRKRAMVKGGFTSEADAMRAMATDPASIIEHKFQFPERPWLDRIVRAGPTERANDVRPEEFQKTFGFRGGEFGNWNMGGDGQAALNHAYDALHDLAHTLGVPPKALSLNGDLAIAFGARGHGGKESAAAHYERDYRVINLTKIKGAGALAHEWFHALDHYLGQMAGKAHKDIEPSESYLTYGAHWKNNNARAELIEAFKAVVDTMTSKKEGVAIEEEGAKRGLARSQESVKSRLDDLRSTIAKERQYGSKKGAASMEQLKAWDGLAARALAGDPGAEVHVPGGSSRLSMGYTSSEVVRGLNDLYKQVTGRSFDRADADSAGRQLHWGIRSLRDMNDRVAKAQEGTIEERRKGTEYLHEAKRIDGYRASDYWSTPHEMGARAFESYIFDKLAGAEHQSDYLVHAVENKFYRLFDMKPYPEGEERAAINKAFDRLFETIQTKETDKGTALFKRGEPNNAEATARTQHESMVRGAADRIGLKYRYAHEVDDLPDHLQDQVRAAGAEGEVRGIFDPKTGDVWLVGSNIRSEGEAMFVALHESAHRGLVKIFGEDLRPVLEQIFRSNERVQEQARVLMLKHHYDRALATEEVLADMALRGQARNLKGWQAFVDFLRDWLVKRGFNLKVSDDMAEFIAGAAAHAGKDETHVYAGEETAKFQRAFHGSPHDFEKFDTSKIGTGEGAQAYGHGLYFAGNKEVAQHYKNALARVRDTYDGSDFSYKSEDPVLRAAHSVYVAAGYPNSNGSGVHPPYIRAAQRDLVKQAQEHVRIAEGNVRVQDKNDETREAIRQQGIQHKADYLEATKKSNLEQREYFERKLREARENLDALKGLDADKFDVAKPTGKMYEVELAPKENEYLDWDKTYDEQSPEVQHALEKAGAYPEDYTGTVLTGAEIYRHITEELAQAHDAGADSGWTSFVQTLNDSAGSQEAASKYLASIGIPGIKYLDGSSRGQKTFKVTLADGSLHMGKLPREAAEQVLKAVNDRYGRNTAHIEEETGHHNYVIFDDKHVEVKAKFSRTEAPQEKPALFGVAAKLREGLSDERKQQEVARGGFRAALASLDRHLGTADAALDKARKAVDEIPIDERWKAMYEYQTGGARAVADEKLRPIFEAWKQNVDERARKIQDWDEGYLKEVLPNYFSQMWKDPAKALEWYQRMMGKGPLEGGKSFLKKRAYATYREGMSWKVFDDQGGARYFQTERDARAAAGVNDLVKPPLEPVSQNFIDIAQLSLQQMDKFISMHEFRQWLKEEKGWVKLVRRGETPPAGYAKVDDPAFRSLAVFPVTDPETGKAGAASIHSDYMVPALIARDLNNYLSKGFGQFALWRSFRYAQNLMLSARLGFSAFHAGFTTMDTLVSHTDVGARYLLQGDVAKALQTWGKAITSPISAPLEGRKLLRQFYGEAAADADTGAVLQFLTEGGARGRMNPTDFNNSWVMLRRAWSDGNIKETAFHALPAVMEGVMRPIMHHLVPWQKMTARVLLAKFELDRVAAQLGKEKGQYAEIVNAMGQDAQRQIAYKVVQQVDDRLGQVAYDNLFWNKFAKEVAQASIQSVGWNVGTANVILGGAKDVTRLFKPEELLAPLDKAGKVDGTLGRVTGRLSYLISLNLTVGMMGAALNYLLTGEDAKDLRDYFFPRTGRKNPDGSAERISMPSYIKDEYALSQHPVTTVQHKLHPFFSMVAELLKNEDFYGNQIINKDDPWTKIAQQAMAYLGKSIEPYAVQNLQQNRSKGETGPMAAAPFIGITPAPASVSRTPFEAYVAERYASAFHQSLTPEGTEKAQARRDAIAALKDGKPPDLQLFTPQERMSIFTAVRTPIQLQRFNRLSIQEKISAWERATPEERAQYQLKAALAKDFMRHQMTMEPEVRAKTMEILRAG